MFWVVTTFLLRVQQKTKTNMDLGKNKVIQLKFWIRFKLGLQTKFHNVNESIDFSYK